MAKPFKWVLFLLGFTIIWHSPAAGEEYYASTVYEDTMLMFVGEDLDVLTIASRREESAWQAPAIAQVIHRKEFLQRGDRTLSDALSGAPGFHMASREWGTLPYLRGIPNSILFLYDTLPLNSDITKNLQPLDDNLSLASVKRIEIIRGPGSVLWGPDAFAGIVNVVPLTGKDVDGVETGIFYGDDPENQGYYANLGYYSGQWDGFLSVSGNRKEPMNDYFGVVDFWSETGQPVPPEERFGWNGSNDATYQEASIHMSYGDWMNITARITDNHRPYLMENNFGSLKWRESRSAPSTFVKLEAGKPIDHRSAVRVTGSFNKLEPKYEIIDRTLPQQEQTYYGEMIYDRSFMAGNGLLTAGLSFRKKEIENAPIWDSYLPDYLGSDNLFFLPSISEKDYNTQLFSLFGQYNQKVGQLDLWIGARADEHDDYQDHISYNAGVSWSPIDEWILKLLYGSAYRTPFSRQLLTGEQPDLEMIKSFDAHFAWKPNRYAHIGLGLFYNRIENHIIEDPYAGLSSPNHQNIYGIELEGEYSPLEQINLIANVTLLTNDGPNEVFRYNDTVTIGEDGDLIRNFIDIEYPYSSGPDAFGNLKLVWNPLDRLTAFCRLGYFSSQKVAYYPQEQTVVAYPSIWLMDSSLTLRNLFLKGLELEITGTNLFDKDYDIPGTYHSTGGEGRSIEFLIRKRW